VSPARARAGCALVVLACAVSPGAVHAINKCVVNGKTVYQEAECPRGSVQKPIAERLQSSPGAAAPAPAAATGPRRETGAPWPKLPELQPGQWTIEGHGETKPITLCGHPLQSLYSEYEALAKLREQGCKVDASSPRPGSVQVSTDCPASSKLGELKTSFIVVSPNPQYVSVQFTHKGRPQIQSAKRIGDC
jgi:hypothetical protein